MSTPDIALDIMTGSEITKISTYSVQLFWLPRPNDNLPKREVGMDSAVGFRTDMRKEWGKLSPALMNSHSSIGGQWSDNRYNVAEGTLLQLRCAATQYGRDIGQAWPLLLCSKDAPLHVITYQLSCAGNAMRNKVTATGRFWVLNEDTMEAWPDMPVLSNAASHYAADHHYENHLEIHEAAPAQAQVIAERFKKTTVATEATGAQPAAEVTLSVKRGKRVMG